MSKDPAIETYELTKYYGKIRGIEGLDLQVEKGDFFGFIGPNGAGKSTAIRTLLGLIKKTSGSAKVLGYDISEEKEKILENTGYLPSEIHFYSKMKVKDAISYSAALRKKDCTKRAEELSERLDLDLNKRVEDLSLGNRKKVGSICAVQHHPDLLILDEPMSGLDPMGRRDVREAIQELNRDGVTIFYSSHLLSDVESISHRVAMIVDGKIVREGSVDEITESCGVEYHVRTRAAILQNDLPEGVAPTGHPQEWVCADDAARDRLLAFCLSNGIAVEKMDHKRPSLEDILTEEIARADA